MDMDLPFITHLSFPRPHQTYAPTKEFWNMYAEDEIEMPPNRQWKMTRKGDWRYVYYPREMFAKEYPDGFGELYNIATDPWEMENLYFEDSVAEKRGELERDLFDWLVTSTRVVGTNGIRNSDIPQAVTRYNVATNADGKIGPRQLGCIPYKNYL